MANSNILRSNIDHGHSLYDSVGEMVSKQLEMMRDDHVCLINARTEEQLTVSELKTRANSIAVALIERGIDKTDIIAFSGQVSIQHSILRFGTLFTGNTIMPLSPTYGKHEVELELRTANVNVIFSSVEDLHKFDAVLKESENNNTSIKLVLIFDGKHEKYVTYEQLLKEGRDQTLKRIPYFDVSAEDILCVMHTSGSTGRPKRAAISYRALLNANLDDDSWLRMGFISPVIIGLELPFGHISGTLMIPMHITNGSTVVIFGGFDEELLLRSIEKYRINVLPVFPSFGRRLIDGKMADKYDLSSLKYILVGGSAFPVDTAKAFVAKYGLKFRDSYAFTEYLYVTHGSNISEEYIPGNCGQVSSGTEVKIIDLNTGESLGAGIDGEICVRGCKMFSGYLKGDRLSKDGFDKDGWFRSGDIGHYDDKQRLFITDRLREVIRIGIDDKYLNISPIEIEQYLLTHKAIEEVAVIGVNNSSGTHWPRAYVVLKVGQTVSGKDIQQFVSDTLSYAKHLKGGVIFVDRIQRISVGKVDRKYYRNLIKDEVIE